MCVQALGSGVGDLLSFAGGASTEGSGAGLTVHQCRHNPVMKGKM